MYIDSYIIENLLINYINTMRSCTSILTKNFNSRKQKFLGSILGTIYSVAYIYPSLLKILFTVPSKFIFIIIITLIYFNIRVKKVHKNTLMFYLVNIFISGSTYFIIYFTGISHLKISFLISCAYFSCKLLQYIYEI